MNGTLTANTGSHDRYNAGVNLNYGINGVNFFGGYAFRQDRYDRSILTIVHRPRNTLTRQLSVQVVPCRTHYDLEWEQTFRLMMSWKFREAIIAVISCEVSV